jgi:CubicO group peptidase (beta-lactamase class C family)
MNIKITYYLSLISLIGMSACGNEKQNPSVNYPIFDTSLTDTTYANRALSLFSITDKQWLEVHYEQIATDTFLCRTFFEKSLTLVQNKLENIPFKDISEQKFKLVYFGNYPSAFAERLAYYCDFETIKAELYSWETVTESDNILLVINQLNIDKESFADFFEGAYPYKNQITVINFEQIKNLLYCSKYPTVLQIYESNAITQDWAAQLIFGGIQAKGLFPITLSDNFQKGQGDTSTPIIRLRYTLPESVNMNAKRLGDIEKIMARAIRKKAIPGGQVMVIKSGQVVHYQSYGNFTYDKNQAVHNLNLYDVASVTKAFGTTLATMKLYDDGLLDIEKRLKDYVPKSQKSPSRNLKIRHLLTHRTGLPPNAPISKYVRIKDTVSTAYKAYFASHNSKEYPIKIVESQYMSKQVQQELWNEIYKIRPGRSRNYLYSDVNFALIQSVNETISGEKMDKYLDRYIYHRLGLNKLLFNPLKKYSKDFIAPTILDKKWRYGLLQGEVHDEMAALLGGVSGNAGLFANANELGILSQMLLNRGNYAGEEIFSSKTVNDFTAKKYSGHRALGFDKKGAGCYEGASKETFGHSGYTGTCVWIDPQMNLIYIFLSNRVYPDPKNTKLMDLKTRKLVHRAIYKSLK